MSGSIEALAPFDGDAILPLADAKLHLRVDGDDENALIGALRDAAIDVIERHTSRPLSRRQFLWRTGAFTDALRPMIAPLASVDAFAYRDASGTNVALAAGWWTLLDGRIVAATAWPRGWSRGADLRITLSAGYEDAARDAPALLAAVKLLLGHLYAQREAGGDVDPPAAVSALCRSYRLAGV